MDPFVKRIQDLIQEDVLEMRSVHGGSVSEAYRIRTPSGTFFVKHNSEHIGQALFDAEVLGLKKMAATKTVVTPNLLLHHKDLLIIDWVDTGRQTAVFWENFGRTLAELHKVPQSHFGFESNNFIGRAQQINTPMISAKKPRAWFEFFKDYRLKHQLGLAKKDLSFPENLANAIEVIIRDLDGFLGGVEEEPPALIHGDLWSGNYLADRNGQAVLLDPSCSYSHREMEFGMLKLFGNCAKPFYEAYHSAYPLQDGWERRVQVYKLYHLLNHFNLFGASYLSSIGGVLRELDLLSTRA